MSDKVPIDHSGSSKAALNSFQESVDGRGDSTNMFAAKPSFSKGKSPPPNGVAATGGSSSAGGLGEGTPKVGLFTTRTSLWMKSCRVVKPYCIIIRYLLMWIFIFWYFSDL